MRLDAAQVLFAQQFHVARGHEVALAGHGVDIAGLQKLVVGALGGDDADAQILGQRADGRQGLVLLQGAGDDLRAHLLANLLVDGRSALVVDEQFHGMPP